MPNKNLELRETLKHRLFFFHFFSYILVALHIIERISTAKASWMYAQRSVVSETNCELLEEVCALAALLMLGEGPNALYAAITPFRVEETNELTYVSPPTF